VASGRLDLQDVGAQVGEQSADRVGIGVTQVEHPHRRQNLTPVNHGDQY